MNDWRHTISIMVAVAALVLAGVATWRAAAAAPYLLAAIADIDTGTIDRRDDAREHGLPGVVFLGDIMLARDVERRAPELLPEHQLTRLSHLLADAVVVGNFEASVPEVHEPTPSMVMKFSVPNKALNVLVEAGITHLSLANNHALDHGPTGFSNTVREFRLRGLEPVGHPSDVAASSVSYIESGDKILAILALNATYGYPKENEWGPVLEVARARSDAQIAYIHWGDEYEIRHSDAQEDFAHALIDAGIDLVVGHHPHVVQDVSHYNDRMIFYSLGNTVFDQYFSSRVTEGLVLKLSLEDDEWRAFLHPVETRSVKTQPREMSEDESKIFLESLAERSDTALREDILAGSLPLQF